MRRRAGGSGWPLALTAVLAAGEAMPAPFVPTDDAAVLARVPVRTDAESRALERLRSRFGGNPADAEGAVALAHHYLVRARTDRDPRYFGYAAAALARWSGTGDAPPEVRVVRARINSYRHRFAAAAADLEASIAAAPENPPAWLDLAQVRQASRDLRGALDACHRFELTRPGLLAATCVGMAESLTGDARGGFRRILRSLRNEPRAPTAAQVWALAALGDIAVRRGRDEEARRLFAAGLAVDPQDNEILRRLSDQLLAGENAAPVVALLAEHSRDDSLLLRLAIAETRLEHPVAAAHRAMLTERLEASRRRGEPQVGAEARYLLDLAGDAPAAARSARAHFRIERTPEAALLAVRAAASAGMPAPEEVLDWIDGLGLEDVRIGRLRATSG